MRIDKAKCIGCGLCVSCCPMEAIGLVDGAVAIDAGRCVECRNCTRFTCPVDAIYMQELRWPHTLVESLSNPIGVDESSGVSGRGTAEMKTNDVTGRIRPGFVGLCLELGRPGISTTFYDVEKVCKALAPHVVEFEALNPVTAVMTDVKTGAIQEDVLPMRVLSAIVETLVEAHKLKDALRSCRQVAAELDTVFSIGLSSLVKDDGSTYFDRTVQEMGLSLFRGGKTNVGLGKPAYPFDGGTRV